MMRTKNLFHIKKRINIDKSIFAWALFIFLFIYCFALLAMYVWGFFTSLKDISEYRVNMFGIPSGAPWTWEWGNYVTAFQSIYVPVYLESGEKVYYYLDGLLVNSFVFAFLSAGVSSLSQWFIAAVLAKNKDLKATKIIMATNIVLMMIPIYGTLPATLRFYKNLNVYDTWFYVILASISIWGQYLIVYYAYLTSIGKEYYEAAYIDGAGTLRTLFSIILPLTSQMLFIVFLLGFISSWNDYMSMVIWMPSHPTLAYGLYKFSISSNTEVAWPPLQVTGCMILMVPILLLFLRFQDLLIGNIRMGGLKF